VVPELTKRSILVGEDLGNTERIDLFFIVMNRFLKPDTHLSFFFNGPEDQRCQTLLHMLLMQIPFSSEFQELQGLPHLFCRQAFIICMCFLIC